MFYFHHVRLIGTVELTFRHWRNALYEYESRCQNEKKKNVGKGEDEVRKRGRSGKEKANNQKGKGGLEKKTR